MRQVELTLIIPHCDSAVSGWLDGDLASVVQAGGHLSLLAQPMLFSVMCVCVWY